MFTMATVRTCARKSNELNWQQKVCAGRR